MSGVLKALRGELVDTVTGITTYDHVPARVNLPAAFVLPGQPYIEAGETFGEKTVRFGLVLLTHPTLNQIETDDLDALIETTQHALDAAGWRVESVQQPAIQDLNGSDVLATEITVAALATFPTD
jgi:hypothetical protein